MSSIEQIATAVEQFTKKSAAEIEALKAENRELAEQHKSLAAAVIETAQRQSTPVLPTGVQRSGPGAGGLMQMLRDDEGLKALREQRTKSAMLTVPGGVGLLTKALVGDEASSVNDLYPVMPQRAPGIYNDQRAPVTLVSLMPRMTVGAGSFEYVSLDSSYTNDADYQVAQGDTKPETSLPMELLTANIATLAVTLPVSEQVLADAPALMAFINSKLSYSVLQKLEFEVVNGTGGTGKIDGLLHMGTTFTPVSDSEPADAIGQAIAELQTLGWVPGAVLLHPRTWHQIRSVRIDAGTGEYLAGGWDSPAAPNIWGTRVIVTPAMPETKAAVLDLNQVMLLDRQNVSLQFGYTDQQFVQNLRTARAEMRAGLMVAAPTAVQVMDI